MMTADVHDQLTNALRELEGKLGDYRIFHKYLVPDFVLFHLGGDVLEQAQAVRLVAEGPAPRAAIANARAAFEAAMDMLVLVAEPSLYDEMGAFARVCELLTWEDMYARRDRADAVLDLPLQERGKSPDEIVAEEAQFWEEHSPGVSRMYQRVLAVARDEVRWKHHWSGMTSLLERATFIAAKNKAYEGFVEIADVLWGLQSVHAHPAPRSGIRPAAVNEQGQLVFGSNPNDDQLPVATAAACCTHALDAMRARETYIK
jgi:hypothetical protein